MFSKVFSRASVASLMVAASTISALAHHPMGGKTPSNFMEGLLSGVGHPIIGLDHLAFVIAVGIAAAMIGSRFMLPLVFIVATMIGTGLHVMAIGLPAVEMIVSLSVAAVGISIIAAYRLSMPIYAGLFGLAGLFHGHAYGEAIFGAESTPLIAYLAGFGVTQYAIAVAAGYVVYDLIGKGRDAFENAPARIAGGMVAGAGALLVGEKTLTLIGLG